MFFFIGQLFVGFVHREVNLSYEGEGWVSSSGETCLSSVSIGLLLFCGVKFMGGSSFSRFLLLSWELF